MQKVQTKRRADSEEWEQIVYAEVIVPDVPNPMGDFWTKRAVQEAAYLFMREGFGIDIEHDNVDISDRVYVAESFVARPNDPDFIEGAWVIGMKIDDPDIWQQVLNCELNGFSYEAMVSFVKGEFTLLDDYVRTGVTEPSTDDGHVHTFVVMVGEDNRPQEGGTDEVNGHFHTITTHTVTDETEGHKHRYNLVVGKDGK